MYRNLRLVLLAALAWAVASVAAYAEGLDELPKDVQDELYNSDMIDPMQPTAPSAYRDWKAKNPPPWTIGYASSYAGNTWRAAVMNRLQNEIIPKWKELGLLKEVIITQSNLDDSLQIQQMRQLVDQASTPSSCAAPTRQRSTRRSSMPMTAASPFSPRSAT